MKKNKKYILLAVVFILIGVTGLLMIKYGSTYAKYISDSIWNYYFKTKEFYFSSDYLDTESKSNVNKLWDGTKVDFNLKNNINEEAVTGYDINYSVTCTIEGDASTHAECKLNGTTSNEATGTLSSSQVCINTKGDNVVVSEYTKDECELGGYSWSNQTALKDMYFEIVLTDSNYVLTDVNVNITATSTTPYHKVISGNFKLYKIETDPGKLSLSYNNYSNYDKLVVTNSYNSNKCITISWNSDNLLIDTNYIDMVSYNSDSNGYINSIKLLINNKSSNSIIFHKRNTSTYDISAFTMNESTGC